MALLSVPLWKEAPFVRLVLPFITGILLQFYTGNPSWINVALLCASSAGIVLFAFAKLRWQFLNYTFNGILFNVLLIACGGIFLTLHDPFPVAKKVENFKRLPSVYAVTISEPLSEKQASWKAQASIISIHHTDTAIFPCTNIIVYFRKDSGASFPVYGQRVLFTKTLQQIKNPQPGSKFNYQQYCAFKNIHYQVFLAPGDYLLLPGKRTSWFTNFILQIRNAVLGIIKENIPGKIECGLASALLIGYKDGLDRDLVQSYSNTGVVHVIAISGLHLGLIYALLRFIFLPLSKKKNGKWFAAMLIISGLWIFSFLAGASPSVLRSAVMFTFIVLGECISKKSSLINNLCASAFLLLCIDPFWLWDLGFILSYTALLSIAIFNKPVYQLFPIKNKIGDALWKLNAVTLSAQLLTMPVIIYNFGQFPNLFLLTNFLAIPLSSIILIGELILCALYYFEKLALQLGNLLSLLIKGMNESIRFMDSFSFSSTRGLEINMAQVVLLYVFIALFSTWLMKHRKIYLPASLGAAILFFVAGMVKIWQ